jgi:hypothetical protein
MSRKPRKGKHRPWVANSQKPTTNPKPLVTSTVPVSNPQRDTRAAAPKAEGKHQHEASPKVAWTHHIRGHMEFVVYLLWALVAIVGLVLWVIADGEHRSALVWTVWFGAVLICTAVACWQQKNIWEDGKPKPDQHLSQPAIPATSPPIANQPDKRAYIIAKQPSFDLAGDLKDRKYTVPVENTGPSAGTIVAKKVYMLAGKTVLSKTGTGVSFPVKPDTLRDELIKAVRGWRNSEQLVAKDAVVSGMPDIVVNPDDIKGAIDGSKAIYLIGGYAYKDGVGGIRTTQFSFRYDAGSKQWRDDDTPGYNRID